MLVALVGGCFVVLLILFVAFGFSVFVGYCCGFGFCVVVVGGLVVA